MDSSKHPIEDEAARHCRNHYAKEELHSAHAPAALHEEEEEGGAGGDEAAAPQWDTAVSEHLNSNGATEELLDISSHDGDLHVAHDAHRDPACVLLVADRRQVPASCDAKAC